MLPPRSNTGFTLVEIMVVVFIMLIAAGLVVPLASATSSSSVVSASRMVAADLQYAQSVAISTQTPVTVTFNQNGKSYTLSNQSGSLINPMTKLAYTVNFTTMNGYGRMVFSTVSFGSGSTVTFDTMGAPDNAGTVTLTAGPYVRQIAVEAATGNVNVTGS